VSQSARRSSSLEEILDGRVDRGQEASEVEAPPGRRDPVQRSLQGCGRRRSRRVTGETSRKGKRRDEVGRPGGGRRGRRRAGGRERRSARSETTTKRRGVAPSVPFAVSPGGSAAAPGTTTASPTPRREIRLSSAGRPIGAGAGPPPADPRRSGNEALAVLRRGARDGRPKGQAFPTPLKDAQELLVEGGGRGGDEGAGFRGGAARTLAAAAENLRGRMTPSRRGVPDVPEIRPSGPYVARRGHRNRRPPDNHLERDGLSGERAPGRRNRRELRILGPEILEEVPRDDLAGVRPRADKPGRRSRR